MKRLHLLLAAATISFAAAGASADEITVMSWGGAYAESQVEAYHKPWMAMTGHTINSVDADNPATPLKAQVEAGNVTVDVFDVEEPDALRLCDEGMLQELDVADLPAGDDGTAAADDFLPGAATECFVTSIVFSHVFAFDESKITGEQPTTIADFFDTAKFPGKRGLRKSASPNLEMALLADGVPTEEVYDVLGTDEGLDRAFAKLDSIKGDVVWWDAGAQPPQLLADGEVAMTTAYNGRIFNAMAAEGKPFKIVWDGQGLYYDVFVIAKGAPNAELAWDFIKFATDTKRLADQAKWISYGPARQSSAALIGKYKDGVLDMGPHMPTNPDYLKNALVINTEFLADNQTELEERFNAWLASN